VGHACAEGLTPPSQLDLFRIAHTPEAALDLICHTSEPVAD